MKGSEMAVAFIAAVLVASMMAFAVVAAAQTDTGSKSPGASGKKDVISKATASIKSVAKTVKTATEQKDPLPGKTTETNTGKSASTATKQGKTFGGKAAEVKSTLAGKGGTGLRTQSLNPALLQALTGCNDPATMPTTTAFVLGHLYLQEVKSLNYGFSGWFSSPYEVWLEMAPSPQSSYLNSVEFANFGVLRTNPDRYCAPTTSIFFSTYQEASNFVKLVNEAIKTAGKEKVRLDIVATYCEESYTIIGEPKFMCYVDIEDAYSLVQTIN